MERLFERLMSPPSCGVPMERLFERLGGEGETWKIHFFSTALRAEW